MALVTKPFTFANGAGNLIDAVQVNADFDTLYALVNALLDDANIKPGAGILLSKIGDGSLGAKLGVDEGATKRRGKSIISASESRTNVAYGLLTTPDRVQNIVLPTDGLIFLAYQAIWQESVASAARAAIFLGANQLKIQTVYDSAAVPEAALINSGGTAGNNRSLHSFEGGLIADTQSAAIADDVTTGQVIGSLEAGTTNGALIPQIEVNGVARYLSTAASAHNPLRGGVCAIFAAAGTYDVSVQFKASSGSVTAKNRKLWVWTLGF